MKKTFFAITSFLMINQASALTAAEFSAEFIAQVNHRLEITNQERSEAKKTPYCLELNKAQARLIQKTAAQPDVTVGDFATIVAENLKCYPEFWAPWERKNIGGVLFNTKAFVMDTFIVRDALADLAGGRTPNDAEALLEYSAGW